MCDGRLCSSWPASRRTHGGRGQLVYLMYRVGPVNPWVEVHRGTSGALGLSGWKSGATGQMRLHTSRTSVAPSQVREAGRFEMIPTPGHVFLVGHAQVEED